MRLTANAFRFVTGVTNESEFRRRIPDWVLSGGRSAQVAWLRGFLQTDGKWVLFRRKHAAFSVYTNKHQFAQDLQALLLSFGIASFIERDDPRDPTWSVMWRLVVVRFDHVRRLHALIPWEGAMEDQWRSVDAASSPLLTAKDMSDHRGVHTVTTCTPLGKQDAVVIESDGPIVLNGIVLR